MRNKNIKIMFTIMLLVICISCISNIAFADFNFTRFDSSSTAEVDKAAKNVMGTAIQVIRIVATGVSIIMLSYLGMKYMMSSPNEKAEFKKSAGIFALGAVLVFAAGNILGIIMEFVNVNI